MEKFDPYEHSPGAATLREFRRRCTRYAVILLVAATAIFGYKALVDAHHDHANKHWRMMA